jgi:hypothetical protein
MSDLVNAARENLVYTYETLARAVYPDGIRQGSGYVYCTEDPTLVLASFAIGFDIPAAIVPQALEELAGHCAENPLFRLFTTDGDSPPSLPIQLMGHGFLRYSTMDVWAWTELGTPETPTLFGLALNEVSDPSQRTRLAQFMVSVFFTRRSQSLRRLVVRSMAEAPHRMFALKNDNTIVGGFMLAESSGAIGLYNLCIDARYRRRTFGSRMIDVAKGVARDRNKPLVLQAEPSLGTWYAKNSFCSIGKVQIFGQSSAKS